MQYHNSENGSRCKEASRLSSKLSYINWNEIKDAVDIWCGSDSSEEGRRSSRRRYYRFVQGSFESDMGQETAGF